MLSRDAAVLEEVRFATDVHTRMTTDLPVSSVHGTSGGRESLDLTRVAKKGLEKAQPLQWKSKPATVSVAPPVPKPATPVDIEAAGVPSPAAEEVTDPEELGSVTALFNSAREKGRVAAPSLETPRANASKLEELAAPKMLPPRTAAHRLLSDPNVESKEALGLKWKDIQAQIRTNEADRGRNQTRTAEVERTAAQQARRARELAAKEAALAKLVTVAAAKDDEAAAKLAEAVSRTALLESREQAAQAGLSEHSEAEQKLEERERVVAEQHTALTMLQQRLIETESQQKAITAALLNRDRVVGEREASLNQRETGFTPREEALAAREEAVDTRDAVAERSEQEAALAIASAARVQEGAKALEDQVKTAGPPPI